MTPRPLIARLLQWRLPAEDRDEILGDLDEQFLKYVSVQGERRARAWYRRQALDLIWRYRRENYRLDAPPAGGRPFMLIDDFRHVWRRFRAEPTAAMVTLSMLAAAIGLSTATFAVLDSLVLERAPFPHADRLRTVSLDRHYGSDNPELINLIRGWRAAGIFESVEAAGVEPLRAPSSTGTVATALVTPGLFEMLGVRPIRGRAFTEEDASAGSVEPVLISERLWQSALSDDRSHLGEPFSIAGREFRVIGVMPADFRFPSWDTVMWRPLSVRAVPFPASAGRYAYVRLPVGVPEADILAHATRAAGEADARFTARPHRLLALPIGGAIDEYAGRAIPLFAGAVGLIFLALCANASSLLLAQITTRRREIGIRLAIGASRWRLLRECVVEHATLGAAGVAAGIWIAGFITTVVPQWLGSGFNLAESLNPINVDARALAIAGSLGFAAVLLAGLLPAWIGTRLDPSISIKPAEGTHTESRAARATTRTMLVTQVAFASMLIVGATLLARSFERMANVDRGMDARGVHTLTAFVSSAAAAVLDDLEARIGALPGVEGATIDGAAPPEAGHTTTARWRTGAVHGTDVSMHLYEVRPRFFEFYGITLLKGRRFAPDDPADVAIVGERIAALLWPNQDPLGKTMSMESGPLQFRVIGVAKEITLPSLAEGVDLPEMYAPHSGRRRVITASWRCFTSCPDRQQLLRAVHDVDQRADVIHVRSTEESYARHLVRPRASAQLGTTFAAVAFATSGAGLFAVLSYTVGRRRREFGIRIALGATPAVLRRSVSRDALGIATIGGAIGGLGAWSFQRSLEAVVYGISPGDPVTWLTMISIVVVMTILAAWRPCQRAARMNPVELLRQD
jgi:putative ABC transport system permease protein